MKIYSCHTPSHDVLYAEHYLPSLPATFENRTTRLTKAGNGDYMSEDFLQTLERKLHLVLDSISSNRGSAILWSDVDIIFLEDPSPILTRLLKHRKTDIWFQKEHPDKRDRTINAGLVLMRCNDAVARLYRDAMAIMKSTAGFHDQDAINQLLRGGAGVKWDFLPPQFAARAHGWPPRRDIVAYHANVTMGGDSVGQKVRQFRELDEIRKSTPESDNQNRLLARLGRHLLARHG